MLEVESLEKRNLCNLKWKMIFVNMFPGLGLLDSLELETRSNITYILNKQFYCKLRKIVLIKITYI